MSVRIEQLKSIQAQIQKLRTAYHQTNQSWRRMLLSAGIGSRLLYHEFLRDDVQVRAESLAFLMIFSLLPLIAGAFLIFTAFAQFGMVQQALERGFSLWLEQIPAEHRSFIVDYVYQFKDAYLNSIKEKSGTVGIFAVLILVWIGLKTFRNLDQVLNHIWQADHARPWMESFRNFLVTSIVAPFVIVSVLSLPLVLQQISVTRYILESLPLLDALMNILLPIALLFLLFTSMYRYLPVTKVPWNAAIAGAAFSTIVLQILNMGIQLYFQFGMQSAYGKAGVIPILWFWIYLLWMCIILGAEVSYLVAHRGILAPVDPDRPGFDDVRGLFNLLSLLEHAFNHQQNPVTLSQACEATHCDSSQVRKLLNFLCQKKLVMEVTGQEETAFVLATRADRISLRDLIDELVFDSTHKSLETTDADQFWKQSMKSWIHSFEGTTVHELLHPRTSKPPK